MTVRQRRFVEEYLVDLNATRAAVRAGYSEHSHPERLTKQPEVAAAIERHMAARSVRTQIAADQVMRELALLGFARTGDYLRVTEEGDPYVDLSSCTPEQLAAVSEFQCEDFKDGRGKGARDVRRVKIKLHDKRAALVDLGRHLGMFKDRVEMSGPGGGPVQVEAPDLSRLTSEELRTYVALSAKAQGT